MKNLIIVESPTKAKTIKAFLDSTYQVIASKGHIRDLPKSRLGIEIIDKSFTPVYETPKSHKEIVNELKRLAKEAKTICIATDEDREGEAIGYHISKTIGANVNTIPRIVFHEITKTAIKDALKNPGKIDMDKVNAQQARRLLDRIVGFKLSSLVASKIARGMSAGRVQSAALKIIVDREREILKFIPIDYFTISALFLGFEANLISFKGHKFKEHELRDEDYAKEICQILSDQQFRVGKVQKRSRITSSPPPFMTSTLQQVSSNALFFSASKTMQIAQRLYEGQSTPDGHMGVITYMRTDSLNIAKEALSAVRKKILDIFGTDYLPPKAKIYVTKNKAAQEAHEAIRPTNLNFTPDIAKDYLKPDELKLYTLIYNRFMASQMKDAIFESQNISFINKDGEFKANGTKLIFDGFYKLQGQEGKDKILPDFKEDALLDPTNLKPTRHTTQPPPRYVESSLIKTMEALGIGRPSTYAPTISLLVNREYIVIEKRSLIPQESAFKLIDLLDKHFEEIVDSAFSASLESKLDDIADKKLDWQHVLWDFYEPFINKINDGKINIESQKKIIPTGEFCPECGSELVVRNGRYGEFTSCSAYPKCKYIKREEKEEQKSDQKCEKCGRDMIVKMGRNGEFLACSGYPDCKNTKSLKGKGEKKIVEGVPCPLCGSDIVTIKSRFGIFYSCSSYPKCTFTSKFEPTVKKCPKCQYPMAKRTLRGKDLYECVSKECKNRLDLD
ncbi:MAG: type I DNA topoisomerase [Helicobacter sp.]|nr:type I DNA topoisomerase [Helicobacter sp.]